MTQPKTPDRAALRSFGFIVGGAFGFIAAWRFLVHSHEVRGWAVALFIGLTGFAAIAPTLLYWPYRGWMALGSVLGWVNTRVILGLVFYGVLSPIGVIARAAGRDPLARRPDRSKSTYKETDDLSSSSLETQF